LNSNIYNPPSYWSGNIQVAGVARFDGNLWLAGQLIAIASGIIVNAQNADNSNWIFNGRDNGVGLIEVARLQSADDPYWQFTNMRLLPGAAVGTPLEGFLYYDSASHKLMVRAAAGWETVTSVP
jgi:hypothetical protein